MTTTTRPRPQVQPLRKPPRDLPFPLSLYQSAVGKKWAMALTGIGLLGFVLAHMFGNLKLYIGFVEHDGEMVHDLDVYAEALKTLGSPILPEGVFLWVARLGLLAMVAIHIHAAYSLTRLNQASTTKYENKSDWVASNFAGRTMRVSGVIVLFYIIWHLLDFTIGWSLVNPDFVKGNVYDNMVASFTRWNGLVAIFYIVANILLSIHIFHGAWSMFQSLGWNNPRFNAARRYVAAGIAGLILVGNISFPIAIMADLA